MTSAPAPQQTSETPILDRLIPVPVHNTSGPAAARSQRMQLIALFVGLIIGVWISSMIWSPTMREASRMILGPVQRFLDVLSDQTISENTTLLSITVALVAAPASAIFAVIVAHELGHFIAGLAAGLKFVSMRFGPIQINSPFRLSLQRPQRTGAFGWTVMVPRGAQGGIRLRLLIMVLAGPLNNLLGGLAVIRLAHSISAFHSWFVLMSMLIGAVNLIPFASLSLVSDGRRALMLLRQRPQAERWIAIMLLVLDLRNGVLPEDLRPEYLAMAIKIRDDSPDTVTGYMLAYASSWYARPDSESAHLLEVCLQYARFAPPMLREALVADAGVFQGRKRKRDDLARGWLADLPQKTYFPGLRQRVEAAICEAQNDVQGSLNKIAEVEAETSKLPDQQQRMVSLRLLARWRSELQAKLQSSQEGPA